MLKIYQLPQWLIEGPVGVCVSVYILVSGCVLGVPEDKPLHEVFSPISSLMEALVRSTMRAVPSRPSTHRYCGLRSPIFLIVIEHSTFEEREVDQKVKRKLDIHKYK